MPNPETADPAWHKNHDLAVMRQALAKLEEAANLIAAAECSLGDMPPIPSLIHGHLDQMVGDVLGKVIVVGDLLKAAINDR